MGLPRDACGLPTPRVSFNFLLVLAIMSSKAGILPWPRGFSELIDGGAVVPLVVNAGLRNAGVGGGRDAVAVTDYRIGASFSVSLSCLRAPARMFRSE